MRNLSKADGKQGNVTDMLCTTANQIALDNNVDLFIVLTETGRIARFLAKQRPMQTILVCSTQTAVVRQSNTSRGVIGYKVPTYIAGHQPILLKLVLKVAKEQGFCIAGNKVMIFTVDREGTANESVNFKMIEVDDE
jgi:pyruvate kinase